MAYADYNYYKDVYVGTLAADEYTSRAERASDYIDFVTFGRAPSDADEVKKCCCALVDNMHHYDNGGGKASENIDGYSVSYVAGVSKTESRSESMYSTALQYLMQYMYRGCGTC